MGCLRDCDNSGSTSLNLTTVCLQLKENPRPAVLAEVTKGVDLKHAETVDKSAPVIEKDVKVGESKHKVCCFSLHFVGPNNCYCRTC